MADTRPDPARGRWLVIGLVRGVGVALVLLGLMIIEGQLAWPYWSGALLVALGMVGAFVLPRRMARRWRSGAR